MQGHTHTHTLPGETQNKARSRQPPPSLLTLLFWFDGQEIRAPGAQRWGWSACLGLASAEPRGPRAGLKAIYPAGSLLAPWLSATGFCQRRCGCWVSPARRHFSGRGMCPDRPCVKEGLSLCNSSPGRLREKQQVFWCQSMPELKSKEAHSSPGSQAQEVNY